MQRLAQVDHGQGLAQASAQEASQEDRADHQAADLAAQPGRDQSSGYLAPNYKYAENARQPDNLGLAMYLLYSDDLGDLATDLRHLQHVPSVDDGVTLDSSQS